MLLFTVLVIQLCQNIIGPQGVRQRVTSKIHKIMESGHRTFKQGNYFTVFKIMILEASPF